MEQLISVVIGTVLAVLQILSPITLMERIIRLLEKIGMVSATIPVRGTAKGPQKVKYYVSGIN